MNTRNTNPHLIALAATALIAAVSNNSEAVTLTAASFNQLTITGASDIQNSGTFIEAISWGSSGSGDAGEALGGTVNGVTFTASSLPSDNTSSVQLSSTNLLSLEDGGGNWTGWRSFDSFDAADGDFSGDLQDILGGATAPNNNASSEDGSLQLQGLTAGRTYRVQILSRFQSQDRTAGYFDDDTFTAPELATWNRNTTTNTIITFTADAATQGIWIAPVSDPGAPLINAYALHELQIATAPEPSTVLLACLGIVGLTMSGGRLQFRKRQCPPSSPPSL